MHNLSDLTHLHYDAPPGVDEAMLWLAIGLICGLSLAFWIHATVIQPGFSNAEGFLLFREDFFLNKFVLSAARDACRLVGLGGLSDSEAVFLCCALCGPAGFLAARYLFAGPFMHAGLCRALELTRPAFCLA